MVPFLLDYLWVVCHNVIVGVCRIFLVKISLAQFIYHIIFINFCIQIWIIYLIKRTLDLINVNLRISSFAFLPYSLIRFSLLVKRKQKLQLFLALLRVCFYKRAVFFNRFIVQAMIFAFLIFILVWMICFIFLLVLVALIGFVVSFCKESVYCQGDCRLVVYIVGIDVGILEVLLILLKLLFATHSSLQFLLNFIALLQWVHFPQEIIKRCLKLFNFFIILLVKFRCSSRWISI